MRPEPPRTRTRRRGFNLIEVGFGIALTMIVTWVTMDFFVAGRRGVHVVTAALEVNEANLRTFRALAADLRGARDVYAPPLAPEDATVPDFSWTSATEGTHRVEVGRFRLTIRNGRPVPVTSRVIWYLDDHETPPGGSEEDRSFTLYRVEARVDPSAQGLPPRPSKMADGVRELVFFRKAASLDTPEAGTGSRNLRIRMRTARTKTRGSRTGYEAALETTVHLRGAP